MLCRSPRNALLPHRACKSADWASVLSEQAQLFDAAAAVATAAAVRAAAADVARAAAADVAHGNRSATAAAAEEGAARRAARGAELCLAEV